MVPTVRRVAAFSACFATLTCFMAHNAYSYTARVYDPALGKQNLFLLGFGEVILSTFEVKGNESAFETANPWFKDNSSASYRTSILAHGHLTPALHLNATAAVDSRIEDEYRTADPSIFRLKMSLNSTEPIWDGWRFTGRADYDPNRLWSLANLDSRLLTQPQAPSRLEIYGRLESEQNGFLEGGSIKPSFSGSEFTLRERSVFGAFGDLHEGVIGTEMVAGKLEGKRFREGNVYGVRADGTAATYQLANAPVIRNSEEVRVETRDRYNETTILASRRLIRDIDYTVDYERGRILLNLPVPSETIGNDPNYVVIAYDYERVENEKLIGGRVRLMPVDSSRVSGSILHRLTGPFGPLAGIDEPKNLFAADASLASADGSRSGYIEVAGSESDNQNTTPSALRAGGSLAVTDKLTLSGNLLRVEDAFSSFANAHLDPNRNQQRAGGTADYAIGEKQSAQVGYTNIRTLSPGGMFNTSAAKREEQIVNAGYQNVRSSLLRLHTRGELRLITDRNDPKMEDARQLRGILDLDGSRERLLLPGTLLYGLHYELIHFDDILESDSSVHDRITHQGAVTVGNEPAAGTRITLTQKLRLSDNRDLGLFDSREDGTFADARVRVIDPLSLLLSGEYKRFSKPGETISLWESSPVRIERAIASALEYIPIERTKAWVKVGRFEREQWRDSAFHFKKDYLQSGVAWFPLHHLSFHGETEYNGSETEPFVESKARAWDLGLRMNWNKDRLTDATIGGIRRWQTIGSDTSVTYILLASCGFGLGNGLFVRGSIRETLLNEPLDDEKTHLRAEVGYENPHWFRVSAGYERIENTPENNPSNYYRGHGPFVRIAGKF